MTQTKWFIVILLSLLKHSMACYDSIISIGATYPVGDITLKEKESLSINCTLNDDYKDSGNANDIIWIRKDEELLKQYVTVFNNQTSQLRITNMTHLNAGDYGCYLRSPDKHNLTLICTNTVFVGRPVEQVTDFKCISMEWQNLTCNWPAPYYGVPTTWTLEIFYKGVSECPKYLLNEREETNGCILSLTTSPTYKLSERQLKFRLTSSNYFGTTSTNFTIDHYSKVVAAPPVKVQLYTIGISNVTILWSKNPKFKAFPSRMVYQLQYFSQWEPENLKVINFTSSDMDNNYTLNMLNPWTEYTISIRCRVLVAPDESKMWSESITRTCRTDGMVPTSAVQMPVGAYDDVNSNIDMDKRNVTVFWKPLSPADYNGPGFDYKVTVYSNGKKLHHEIRNDRNFTTTFPLLDQKKSYKFVVQSANKFGTNANVSEINVPSAVDKPLDVETFVVTYYFNGTYELSWTSQNNSVVKDVTLFWCKTSHERDNLCQEALSWINVDYAINKYNITVANPEIIYRFAVAVNSHNSSSGMVWSKCIAYINRGGDVSKVKMLSLTTEGPTNISAMWSLDCKERLGIISGFKIMYCIQTNSKEGCHGPQMNKTIQGAESSKFTLQNLRPYTNYSVRVVAMTYTGILGEPGEAKVVQTAESVPEGPPLNVTDVFVTNNSVTIRWNSPEIPNGKIAYYKIFYGFHVDLINVNSSSAKVVQTVLQKGIRSYVTYVVRIKACTKVGCSPLSNPINVTTLIGVPGKPDRPVVQSNETHAFVEWTAPRNANGPITEWRLLVRQYEYGQSNLTSDEIIDKFEILNTTSRAINLTCNNKKRTYSFAVTAVNYVFPQNKSAPLVGPYSEETTTNVCMKDTKNHMSSVALGIIVAISFVTFVIVLVFCIKKGRATFLKYNDVKIDLPSGLTTGALQTNKYPDKLTVQDICSTTKPFYDRLQSISSDEGRSSQSSTETSIDITSVTSVSDNILLSEVDSSDHFDLRTTSVVDSGHETDGAISPDSVFEDATNGTNCHFEFPLKDTNTTLMTIPSSLATDDVPCYSKVSVIPTKQENSVLYMSNSKVIPPIIADASNLSEETFSQVGVVNPHPGYVKVIEINGRLKANENDFQTGYSKVAQSSPALKPRATEMPARGYVMVESIPINDLNVNKLTLNTEKERSLPNMYLEHNQVVDLQRSNYILIDSSDKVHNV
ncbi:hypothetical protein CHUAL_007180 [Chamberlinius hualienensis]